MRGAVESPRLIGSAVEDKVGGRGGTAERPGWWALGRAMQEVDSDSWAEQ